jgi:predicted Zn-dependent peptidase
MPRQSGSGKLALARYFTVKMRATRLVHASRRGFATVVNASTGFKVAALDNGQPTSSVTVLLKAGSRYESKPGLAHTLSNFAFKVRVPSNVRFRILFVVR